MKPKYFATPEHFRAWLRENHDKQDELLVGYYKISTGRPSMTWPESVDQAICFGWIDGVRRKVDEESYCIRFTPRRPTSNWSKVNIDKAEKLIEEGLMEDAGLAAYERREGHRSEVYSYERKARELSDGFRKRLSENREAWEYFKTLTPYVKRASGHWVMNAKQEATRERRFKKLVEACERGEKLF